MNIFPLFDTWDVESWNIVRAEGFPLIHSKKEPSIAFSFVSKLYSIYYLYYYIFKQWQATHCKMMMFYIYVFFFFSYTICNFWLSSSYQIKLHVLPKNIVLVVLQLCLDEDDLHYRCTQWNLKKVKSYADVVGNIDSWLYKSLQVVDSEPQVTSMKCSLNNFLLKFKINCF